MTPNQLVKTILLCIAVWLHCWHGTTALSQTLQAKETLRFEIVENCADKPLNCDIQIDGIGLFSKDSGDDFSKIIKQLPLEKRRVVLHLSSLGGNLAGAIKLGQLLREHEIHTQTGFKESVCYSACAYAFMGGRVRELGPQAKLGVHQFYSKTNELNASTSQSISAMLSIYMDLMGIDKKILQLALSTQPNKITLIGKAQAQQLLIDNSQQPFQAWRLETTDKGQLAIMTSERQPNRPWTVTLVITKVQGQRRLLIQLLQHDKKDDSSILATLNSPVSLVVDNQTQALLTITPWHTTKPGVWQRWCLLNASTMEQLSNPSSDLALLMHWQPEQLQQLRLKPLTRFGKTHLNKYLLALDKN
jgi:hypothetical protein